MLFNSWSITLLVISLASLLLVAGSARTAIRILRFWDASVDTARQISLENESWLPALLIQYGLILQLLALFLLVLAVDSFSETLVGAMCATGAFLANPYGIPLLLVKIFGVFVYGFWLVLHRLDLSSETLPLTRMKSLYLLLLLPLLVVDNLLLVLYLTQLTPDIITSCCGVIFDHAGGDGKNLVGPVPVGWMMSLFYGLAGLLFFLGIGLLKKNQINTYRTPTIGGIIYSLLWLIFFSLSLLVITAVISSYIYGMPFHRCPFDLLKKEYSYIGYLIYFTLFTATFFGMSAGATVFLAEIPGLQKAVRSFNRSALQLCLFLLPLFLAVVSWYPALYLLRGGAAG